MVKFAVNVTRNQKKKGRLFQSNLIKVMKQKQKNYFGNDVLKKQSVIAFGNNDTARIKLNFFSRKTISKIAASDMQVKMYKTLSIIPTLLAQSLFIGAKTKTINSKLT